MRRMWEVKHVYFGGDEWFFASADDERATAVCMRGNAEHRFVGVFPLKPELCGDGVELDLPEVPDGEYEELIYGGKVTVTDGKAVCNGTAMVLKLG